ARAAPSAAAKQARLRNATEFEIAALRREFPRLGGNMVEMVTRIAFAVLSDEIVDTRAWEREEDREVEQARADLIDQINADYTLLADVATITEMVKSRVRGLLPMANAVKHGEGSEEQKQRLKQVENHRIALRAMHAQLTAVANIQDAVRRGAVPCHALDGQQQLGLAARAASAARQEAAAADAAAAVQEMEVDGREQLRVSRECPICHTRNPLRRAAMTTCGHLCCLSCAERRAEATNDGGWQHCFRCGDDTQHLAIHEDVVKEEEGEEGTTRKRKWEEHDDEGLPRGFKRAFVGM
ncbi:hypothetical protein PENTCL1PPCAC_24515, partial [Pristionchus entomophagus]